MKLVIFLCLVFILSNVQASSPELKAVSSIENQARCGFEENKGQVQGKDSHKVNYFYKDGDLTMFLLNTGIAYQFTKVTHLSPYHSLNKNYPESRYDNGQSKDNIRTETYRMDIELIGANPVSKVTREGQSYDYIQYYNFNTFDIHTYSKIIYHDIYPNIDWIIYRDSAHQKENGQDVLKYDFVVHAGGDPHKIKMKVKWAENLVKNKDGSIRMENGLGFISEKSPISFQNNLKIPTQFILKDSFIQFDIEDYDLNQDLIIDPILVWATYYGGSGTELESSCATDASGNVYLASTTTSTTAIASGGYQNSFGGLTYDAFLVKFNNSGVRQWATYYGGTDNDEGKACITDANGNVYLTGRTSSSAGIASGGHQNSLNGSYDAFLVKFNSTGTRQWATYYGGTDIESGISVSTDNSSNVYLAGSTYSTASIASGGHQNTIGGNNDAFLVKFNSAGTRQWATYYGGTNLENGFSCATDASNNIYLAGATKSSNNIFSSGHQSSLWGNWDGFLVKFNASGTRLWGTYYGGANDDYGNGVSTDLSGNVCLSGFTYSNSNIAASGHQNTFGGSNDAFLVKFNSSGTRLWGTYYGGSSGDYAPSCSIDGNGNIYLAGYTLSNSNIALAGYQNTLGGNLDAYLVKFNAAGTRQWGTYYGGTGDDGGYSCVSDGFRNILLAGTTMSSSSISSGGHQNSFGGAQDAFLVKFAEDPVPFIQISKNVNDTICAGTTVNFTSMIVNGGTLPKYRWYKNNIQIDTIANLILSSINDGDSVKCLLKSNASGLTVDSAWSNTIKFKVKPNSFKTLNVSICSNQSYFFKSANRNTTGVYKDTLINQVGCDSIVTLNLTVKDTSSYSFNRSICSNQTYFFNGFNRNVSGIYKDTLVNGLGCDSFLYLNLIVKPISISNLNASICPNQSYFFKGQNRTISGVYKDTLVNSLGCDSIITLNLTVKSSSSNILNISICPNQSYFFKGQNRTIGGIYKDTLVNSIGCDSIVTLNLTIRSISTKILNVSICNNQTYYFKGNNLNTSGIYYDTLLNSVGCDSFVTLNLIVNSSNSFVLFDTICSNQSYLFNGLYRNTSGIYKDTLINSLGCDSFLTLHLFVKSISNHNYNHTTCFNQPYFFNGFSRNVTGIYKDTLMNSLGCDSFVTLNLTILPISIINLNINLCVGDSFLFKGIYRKSSGIYRDTLTNSHGCDSFVTLNLVVRFPSFKNLTINRCDNDLLFFKGQFIAVSGIYKDTLKNQYGCDSFVTLNYTVRPTSADTIYYEICEGQFFFFNGQNRTTTGKYLDTLINSVGCDSMLTLDLKVNPTPTTIIDTSICYNQSFFFKGRYINNRGVYKDTLKTAKNCDSFVTLILKIKQPSYFTLYHKFCSNIPRFFNGRYLDTPGIYLDTLTNFNGCDSFLTLVLQRDKSDDITIYDTICYNDSLYFNGVYLKQAGVYKETLKNKGGCDSFVTLNLNVYPIKSINIVQYNSSVLIADIGFMSYQWYLNANILNNEKRFYIETTLNGDYFIFAIDSHQCAYKSSVFNYKTSSSILGYLDEELKIYPVPTKDVLNLESNLFLDDKAKLSIYSMDGKLMCTFNLKSNTMTHSVSTTFLNQGIYLLKVEFKDRIIERRISVDKY